MNAKPIVRFSNALAPVLIGLLIGTAEPAVAIVLPAPNFSVVLRSGQQIGLRSQYSAFAHAFGDIEGQFDGLTSLPMAWQEFISHAGSVAAVDRLNPAVSSFAEFHGQTQVGKLRAMTHAWVEGGVGTASAVLDMQFMDVFQVDTEGVLHLNWVVSGTADEQILLPPSNQAGSTLTAELYVWPYGTYPTPGLAWNFTNYAKSVFTGTGSSHLLTETFRYPAGSRWWVLGQLNVQSRADANSLLRLLPPYKVETTANFGHTVELFITPDPSTPQASFHSASGYDYRPAPIPEPASGLLLLAGLLALRLITARRT